MGGRSGRGDKRDSHHCVGRFANVLGGQEEHMAGFVKSPGTGESALWVVKGANEELFDEGTRCNIC